ncbi:Mth938-like domain-containing protein [Neomegalonema sp.]|uniref:Mth938-like domain-containing protein n=1 Tax=Neomegalonema sp. TaxID=2039713 RepID=UPI00263047F9|nr:Mth938-like domain-containing protein [Neomegalonema sp.]MDD2868784.1 Mth938-like domain-containing protein [Neomegalonema sp.]
MRMTETPFESPPGGARPIDAYGAGGFRIGGTRREGSLILLETGEALPWSGELTPEALAPLWAAAGDVILLGLGLRLEAPPPGALREAAEAAGAGLDPMSTAAACRAYNVLISEGRRVSAALKAV